MYHYGNCLGTNVNPNQLQKPVITIYICNISQYVEVDNIESLIRGLLSLWYNFEKIMSEVNLVAVEYEIKVEFPAVHAKSMKRFHGEMEFDQPRFDSEERCRIKVFYKLMDMLVANLISWFTPLQEIMKNLHSCGNIKK